VLVTASTPIRYSSSGSTCSLKVKVCERKGLGKSVAK
jgi:hypothetical protein